MSRLVHELDATPSGNATYATPDGGIVQVPQDFAFADTVIATDEDIPTAPLSGNPLSGHPHAGGSLSAPLSQPPVSGLPGAPMPSEYGAEVDPWAGALYETRAQMYRPRQAALTGPPPPPIPANAGPVTIARSVYVRAKHELDSNRHDLKNLWNATYDDAEAARLANEEDPFVRLAGKLRRVRALLGFFEWDRADVMRAAWIGVAVFVIVATVGAFALQR